MHNSTKYITAIYSFLDIYMQKCCISNLQSVRETRESFWRTDVNTTSWENSCVTTKSFTQQVLWGSLHPTGLVSRIPGGIQMECFYRNYLTLISANKPVCQCVSERRMNDPTQDQSVCFYWTYQWLLIACYVKEHVMLCMKKKNKNTEFISRQCTN